MNTTQFHWINFRKKRIVPAKGRARGEFPIDSFLNLKLYRKEPSICRGVKSSAD